MLRSKASLLVPITATLVIHGVLAAGLALAEQYLELQPRHDPITVKINIEPPPPPKKAELPP
ncbi:MAG: hypothetical protein HY698_02480, partial [Deltaproteobacteria bacterium]|nr:hypothetical protein [Deltaproteobacteria bacterium]